MVLFVLTSEREIHPLERSSGESSSSDGLDWLEGATDEYVSDSNETQSLSSESNEDTTYLSESSTYSDAAGLFRQSSYEISY